MGIRRDSTDDESSAEMNDALLRTKWRGEKENQRSCFFKAMNAWRSVVNTVLLVTILVLLLVRVDVNKPERKEIGSDLAGFAPKFAQQIVTFKPDPGFAPEDPAEFFTNETRRKWLDLVPKGLGYVEVGMAYEYDNLPTPLPEYFPNTVFTTSMTHQLHCLYTIIEAYSALQTGHHEHLSQETPWHLSHCFDYLRQSIMCCGDVALEGQQTTFPEGTNGSDGWDAKHVCRDYNQVYRYLTRKRADNEEWI
ncbi:hypothetical protein NLU13_7431 [Sarocladium strictum]|uniref:Oxidase ustYa n=1 Tax=Sarocladium strictum TaxID=5046 RepID=A0AA39GCS7_SARSR|nr:hypothetical protein NLU13_7431 [Sarocladium strictum]